MLDFRQDGVAAWPRGRWRVGMRLLRSRSVRGIVVRRWVLVAIALALCGSAVGMTARPLLAAAASPSVQIIAPTPDQLFYTGTNITFSGTATDATSVQSVRFGVQNRETHQWLQSNGAWGAASFDIHARLTNPKSTSTSWTGSARVPDGDVQVLARAVNTSGATSATVSVEFGSGPQPTAATPGYLTSSSAGPCGQRRILQPHRRTANPQRYRADSERPHPASHRQRPCGHRLGRDDVREVHPEQPIPLVAGHRGARE